MVRSQQEGQEKGWTSLYDILDGPSFNVPLRVLMSSVRILGTRCVSVSGFCLYGFLLLKRLMHAAPFPLPLAAQRKRKTRCSGIGTERSFFIILSVAGSLNIALQTLKKAAAQIVQTPTKCALLHGSSR